MLDSAKGWAGIIRFNARLREMFDAFYRRPDTFSLGVCNGCQLMALLGWVPWTGIPDTEQPRFIRNASERFESRWATVKIVESPAIMLQGMENSVLGIWVAHGEGRLYCPDPDILREARAEETRALSISSTMKEAARREYPFNPNGSISGHCGILLSGREAPGNHAASGTGVPEVAVALDAGILEALLEGLAVAPDVPERPRLVRTSLSATQWAPQAHQERNH